MRQRERKGKKIRKEGETDDFNSHLVLGILTDKTLSSINSLKWKKKCVSFVPNNVLI